MANVVWAGPPSAPWEKLRVGDLPLLEHGFPLRVSRVQFGTRKVGDVVAAYPVLSYPKLLELFGRTAATLTVHPVQTEDYVAYGSYETPQGLLTELSFQQAKEPTIVDVHRLFEAARQAGGALVYTTDYPFAYVPPALIPMEPVDPVSLIVVAAGGFVAGLMVIKALR